MINYPSHEESEDHLSWMRLELTQPEHSLMRPGYGTKLPTTLDSPELEFKVAHDHLTPWTWMETVYSPDYSPYPVGNLRTMSLESSSQGEGIVTTAGPVTKVTFTAIFHLFFPYTSVPISMFSLSSRDMSLT